MRRSKSDIHRRQRGGLGIAWDALTVGSHRRAGLSWSDPTLKSWGHLSHNWINPGHPDAVQPWWSTQCTPPSRPHRGRALDWPELFHGCGGRGTVHRPEFQRHAACHRTVGTPRHRSSSLKLRWVDHRCGKATARCLKALTEHFLTLTTVDLSLASGRWIAFNCCGNAYTSQHADRQLSHCQLQVVWLRRRQAKEL